MHWADVFVKQLSGNQVVSTGISPSGPIHVGNMREILTGDIINRAALDNGLSSRLIYLADDIDPLRKRYPYLSEEYEKYVGMPLCRIPSPDGKGTYSEYYLKPFLETLEAIGVKPDVIRSHSLYADGILAEATKIAIEKRQEIKKILEDMSGRELPEDWYPYNALCHSCGRINSTTVKSFEYPYAHYICRCGNEGDADIRKDDGKMPWRVEWPAKWFALGVTVEPFGKDHAAAGSSYDTGRKIMEEVFGRGAPKYVVYEHIFLKGKGAMHSSTGLTVAASEMIRFSPPEIIRFLIAKNNPSRHLDFDPGMGMLNLIDEFDRYRLAYYGGESVSDEDYRRVYELSRIREDERPQEISFRHLVTLVQIYTDEEKLFQSLRRSGYRGDSIDAEMEMRIAEARYWLSNYAPEQMKFSLLPLDSPVELSSEEKKILSDFISVSKGLEWSADSIHTAVHEIIKNNAVEQGAGFRAFYRVLIGKERGPRLGYFLSNLDRERVLKRLESCASPQ